MRAIVLDMPPAWLDERRRSGADRWDEVWSGVLHVVPPPGTEHQRLAGRLERVLTPIAESRGLEVLHETGVFHSHEGERDYRVPDLVVVRAEDLSERGVEGHAAIAIEILSPGDESRDKLPFYAQCGIAEVWLIEPETRSFELLALEAGGYSPRACSAVLEITLAVVAGPRLRLAWPGGTAEV